MRDYMVDYNPVFDAGFAPIGAVPVRYGRTLQIGETAFGEYRGWTCLSVDHDQAANFMA